MAFNSTATSKEGVMSDFLRFAVQDRIEKGTAPSGYGTNRPLPSVSSAKDVFSFLSSISDEQTINKGGSGLDPYSAPIGDTYRSRRFKFLSDLEGVRDTAYDDATGQTITNPKNKKGLATVGLGFNMDRPDARKVFSAILPESKFDDVYSGKATLSKSQVEKLFDYTVQEAESVVDNAFKGVPLREHQRLALVSMAFNGPSLIGPKLVDAVKSGNTEQALAEILHNSNKKKIRGLGTRRFREAFIFAGTDQGKKLLPDFKTYMSQFA